MRNLKKNLSWITLGCLFLLPNFIRASDAAAAPYTIMISEAYGKPFATDEVSGKRTYGLATGADFEYRFKDYFSAGLAYERLTLVTGSLNLAVDEVDVLTRVTPFSAGSFEPYVLLGAGIALDDDRQSDDTDAEIHLKMGFGVLFDITQNLAIDLGLRYDNTENLHFGAALLGIQARF